MRQGLAGSLAAAGGMAGLGYYLTVTGKLTADTGWGRRVRPLGPVSVQISAPAETVFDVIAAPYLGRTPRAMASKLRVLERGTDMVLAEHYTPVHGGRLTATTLETVTLDRPRRVTFWLARGPVPHVTEEFTLSESQDVTTLGYAGEDVPTSALPGSGGPRRSRARGKRRSAPPSRASRRRQSAAPGKTVADMLRNTCPPSPVR